MDFQLPANNNVHSWREGVPDILLIMQSVSARSPVLQLARKDGLWRLWRGSIQVPAHRTILNSSEPDLSLAPIYRRGPAPSRSPAPQMVLDPRSAPYHLAAPRCPKERNIAPQRTDCDFRRRRLRHTCSRLANLANRPEGTTTWALQCSTCLPQNQSDRESPPCHLVAALTGDTTHAL